MIHHQSCPNILFEIASFLLVYQESLQVTTNRHHTPPRLLNQPMLAFYLAEKKWKRLAGCDLPAIWNEQEGAL